MRSPERFQLLALAALLAGCGTSPESSSRPTLLLTAEQVAALPPDRPGRLRLRTLERTPRLTVCWVEHPAGQVLGLRKNYYADVRIFVFSGRVKVRLGAREDFLGAGSFLSIPRGVQYRIVPADGGPARYLRVVAPDADRDTLFELPPLPPEGRTPVWRRAG